MPVPFPIILIGVAMGLIICSIAVILGIRDQKKRRR